MNASVYVCKFPRPNGTDQLDDYALRLLEQLCTIKDIGRRPLHFAAHSVGGLVVKKALLLARRSSEAIHYAVLSKCFSIAFFGVPRMPCQLHWIHIPMITNPEPDHGSSFLSYEEFSEQVEVGLGLSDPFPPNIRAYLDPHSQIKHESINEGFAPIAFGLRKIWTFVENRNISAKLNLQSTKHSSPVIVSRRVSLGPLLPSFDSHLIPSISHENSWPVISHRVEII
jgi:hypothetical protein